MRDFLFLRTLFFKCFCHGQLEIPGFLFTLEEMVDFNHPNQKHEQLVFRVDVFAEEAVA
jgi:hypothetical protein